MVFLPNMPENRETTLAFDKQLIVDGIGQSRRNSYMNTLCKIDKKLKKKFKDITKQDLIDFIADPTTEKQYKLKNGRPGKKIQIEYTNGTLNMHKINTKRFFKWLLVEDDDEYPPLVRWIKTSGNGGGKPKKEKEIATAEDIQKLIHAAQSNKNKVLVSIVYETACRINEALALDIGDIKTDKYGFYVTIQQTKNRNKSQVRLINSAPLITAYLDTHLHRDELNTPLFYNQHNGERMNYSCAKEILNHLVPKAGIKKHLTWHSFRHGRLTQLAREGWGDRELMAIGGHKTHRMIGEYVKYRDIRKKQLIDAGLLDEKGGMKDQTLVPIKCPVCEAENPSDSKYCRCGRPLNQETAQKLDELQKHQDQHMIVLQHQVELLERRLQAMEKTK